MMQNESTASGAACSTPTEKLELAAQRRVVLEGCSMDLNQVHKDCLALRADMAQAQLRQQLFAARPSNTLMGEVGEALDRLIQTTERFALVIDLTVAAVELLDVTTYRTARFCAQDHVRGCKLQLDAVRRTLADYPTLADASPGRALS